LESVYTARYRGFKSPSLRLFKRRLRKQALFLVRIWVLNNMEKMGENRVTQ
jgi:hypothetical protein